MCSVRGASSFLSDCSNATNGKGEATPKDDNPENWPEIVRLIHEFLGATNGRNLDVAQTS